MNTKIRLDRFIEAAVRHEQGEPVAPGLAGALKQIFKHLVPTPGNIIEFRKPSARKPDENDDWPACYRCEGDGTVIEDQEVVTCMDCTDGTRPFADSEVFLMIYRQGHSV